MQMCMLFLDATLSTDVYRELGRTEAAVQLQAATLQRGGGGGR